MTRQKATFEHVTTVTPRDQNGSIVIPLQDAIDRSGNAGGDGIVYERTDDHVLIGEIVDEKPDGRKHELARAINEFGSRGIKSAALPPAGLEHLGIDRTAIGDGIDVDVWVATDPELERPLIAVTPVIRQTIQFSVGGGQ